MIQKITLIAIVFSFSMSICAHGRSPTIDPVKYELAIRLIKYFEKIHPPEAYPFVGFGHRVLPNENLSSKMTLKQADSLLRSDLNKHLAFFKKYGDKALLLSVLSYNCGYLQILGGNGKPESNLIKKIKQGDPNIEADYLGFCKYRNKVVQSIKRRRYLELKLLNDT